MVEGSPVRSEDFGEHFIEHDFDFEVGHVFHDTKLDTIAAAAPATIAVTTARTRSLCRMYHGSWFTVSHILFSNCASWVVVKSTASAIPSSLWDGLLNVLFEAAYFSTSDSLKGRTPLTIFPFGKGIGLFLVVTFLIWYSNFGALMLYFKQISFLVSVFDMIISIVRWDYYMGYYALVSSFSVFRLIRGGFGAWTAFLLH